MLYIKRSVDSNKEAVWLANDLNEETRRNKALYAGGDVNGAINALVSVGVSRKTAIEWAENEIARCKADLVSDDIKQEPECLSAQPA